MKEIFMKVKAKSFIDEEGNKFIFPGYLYGKEDEVPFENRFWSIALDIRAATGVRMEAGWFEFDDENFPHFQLEINSAGFAHGSEPAYLYAGPKFDELMKNK